MRSVSEVGGFEGREVRVRQHVRDHHLGVPFVACIDAASPALQLILAGHTPADIDRLLHEHPDTTTAFLAALTGHWHRNARKPASPGAPGLRAYQHRALRPPIWVSSATG